MEHDACHPVDFTTSTNMAVSVRYHREDPFERIRLARAAMPTTPLGFITTGMRFISWDRSPESVMRLAFRLIVRHGIGRVQISEPMNDASAALRAARLAREEGAREIVPAVVFTVSPFHDDAFFVDRAAVLAASEDVDRIYVKDPGGLLTPERVRTLLPEVMRAAGEKAVELHSHCTTGLAPVCYVEAARLGVAALHTAARPLANGTSQPSTERTIANLAELGIETGVDLESVAAISDHFEEVARRGGLPPGVPLEYDLSYYKHQVPGGMMTTLSRQLAEIGQEGRLPEVLEEVVRVREELGYPIMVTPFSQFVGTQAVFNVTNAKGRYGIVPDGVVSYALGHYGTPPGPIDADVLDVVLASRRARGLSQPKPEPSLDDLRRTFGTDLSEEELLLRSVLPAAQVDAMLATSAAAS